MKSRHLQSLWSEWLASSDSILRCLHEQTVAVTLRDVPRVERLQPDLDLMTTELRRIDALALAEAKRLAEELEAPTLSPVSYTHLTLPTTPYV